MRQLFLILSILLSICTMAQDEVVVPSPQVVELNDSVIAETDTVSMEQIGKIVKKAKKAKRDWSTWRPDPKRAMWLAIMLPGAGQIYNRKYWKLPIVYGGFLGCIYAMRWNNQMYLDYSQAYLDIMDKDPKTASYSKFLHLGNAINSTNIERYKTIFKSRKDKYRRWRDLSFIAMMAVYALSIVDAYVDASLSQFDISDDLSLRVAPTVVNGNTKLDKGQHNQAIGMHASLTF
ncbi:MAG: hypothetical protein IKP84_09940 [Prevotella sp.]|nr:hypothetical protein [Prevotella sp.]